MKPPHPLYSRCINTRKKQGCLLKMLPIFKPTINRRHMGQKCLFCQAKAETPQLRTEWKSPPQPKMCPNLGHFSFLALSRDVIFWVLTTLWRHFDDTGFRETQFSTRRFQHFMHKMIRTFNISNRSENLLCKLSFWMILAYDIFCAIIKKNRCVLLSPLSELINTIIT